MWSHSTEIKSQDRDNDVPASCWISTTRTGSTFHHFGSSSPCASSSESMMDLPFHFTFAPQSFHLERSHVTECLSVLLDARLLMGDASPTGPLPDAPGSSLFWEEVNKYHHSAISKRLTWAACLQISFTYMGEGDGLLTSDSPFLPDLDASSICTWRCNCFASATC